MSPMNRSNYTKIILTSDKLKSPTKNIMYKENYYFGQSQQINMDINRNEQFIMDDSEPFIKVGAVQGNVINVDLFNNVDLTKNILTRLAEPIKINNQNPYIIYNNDRETNSNSIIYKSGYKIEYNKLYDYKFQDKLKLKNGFWNYTTIEDISKWYIDYENVGDNIFDEISVSRQTDSIFSYRRYLNDSNYELVYIPSTFQHKNTSLSILQENDKYYTNIYGIKFEGETKNNLSADVDVIQFINGYTFHKDFKENEYIHRKFNTENNIIKTNYVHKIGFGETIPSDVKIYDVDLKDVIIKQSMSNIYNSYMTSKADIKIKFGDGSRDFILNSIDDNFGCVRDIGNEYYYTNNQGKISKTTDYKKISPAYISSQIKKYLVFKPKDSISQSTDISLLFYPELSTTNQQSKVYKRDNKYINKLPYNLKSSEPEIIYGYFNTDKTFVLSDTVSKQNIWNENKIYYAPTFGGVCRISNNFKELLGSIKTCKSNTPVENLCVKFYAYKDESDTLIYSDSLINVLYLKISEQPEMKNILTTFSNMKNNTEDITESELITLNISLENSPSENKFNDYIFNILDEDGTKIIPKSIIEDLFFYSEDPEDPEDSKLYLNYKINYPERRLFIHGIVNTIFTYEDILKSIDIVNKDYSISATKKSKINLNIIDNSTTDENSTFEDIKIADLIVDSSYVKYDVVEHLDSNTKFFDIKILTSDSETFEDNDILKTLLSEQLNYEFYNSSVDKFVLNYTPIKHDVMIRFGDNDYVETNNQYGISRDEDGTYIKTYPEYANNFITLSEPIKVISTEENPQSETINNVLFGSQYYLDDENMNIKIVDRQILQYKYTNDEVNTDGFEKLFNLQKNISIGFKILNDTENISENILYNISGNDIGLSCCMDISLNNNYQEIGIKDEEDKDDLKYGIVILGFGSNYIGKTYGIQNSDIISHHVKINGIEKKIGHLGNILIQNIGDYETLIDDKNIRPNYRIKIYFDFICSREDMEILNSEDDVKVELSFVPIFDFFLPGKGLTLTFKDINLTEEIPNKGIKLPEVDITDKSPIIKLIYLNKNKIPNCETETTSLNVNLKTIYFNQLNAPYNIITCNNPNDCFGIEVELTPKTTNDKTNIPLKINDSDTEFLKQLTHKIDEDKIVDETIVKNTYSTFDQIAKIRLDFYNRTTGITGAYSYKSYGYIIMDMCDFECCRKDFSVDTSGIKNKYNINFMALKNLFKYKNGKIKNSITDIQYNDNIVIYSNYVDEDGLDAGEIPEISELKQTVDISLRDTLLHSTNALLKMFENYPNGYFKISLILDYYSEQSEQSEQSEPSEQSKQDLTISIPQVGKYKNRETIRIINKDNFMYMWDSINKYNCRQYVSYPNTIPYDPTKALIGITDENYNNQFIGTFALKNCANCYLACCDNIDNEIDEDIEENTDLYYPIFSESRPYKDEQGSMIIKRDLIDKTPIYITTMLPETKKDELDNLTYSAQLLNGTILFNDSNGNTIQTNTYTITYDSDNENPKINLRTIDNLNHEKNYKINAEIVELIDTDLSSKIDSSTNYIYGYIQRFNDNNYWMLTDVYSQNIDNMSLMSIMKKGVNNTKSYVENAIISGIASTQQTKNPNLYISNDLYLEIDNDGNSTNTNIFEYIREGSYIPITGDNNYIFYGSSKSNIKKYEIDNIKKSCDFFNFVNSSEIKTKETKTDSVYEMKIINDTFTIINKNENYKYDVLIEDSNIIKYYQNSDGKRIVEEFDQQTNYRALKNSELFFENSNITTNSPYGLLFIGGEKYILGKTSTSTLKRQCFILQKFLTDDNSNTYLDTQKYILNSAKSFISVGFCKQLILDPYNDEKIYVNIFYNTVDNQNNTQKYIYYILITCNNNKILKTSTDTTSDIIELQSEIQDYELKNVKIVNDSNISKPKFEINDDHINLIIPTTKNIINSINEPVEIVYLENTVSPVQAIPAITVIQEGSIKTNVETSVDSMYFRCTDRYIQILKKANITNNILYPAVPGRKYLTFYIPIENDYQIYNNINEFIINIDNFTASYKNGSFTASSLEDQIKNYNVYISDSDDNEDSKNPDNSGSHDESGDQDDSDNKNNSDISNIDNLNILDTFFIDVGKYNTVEELVDKINSSVKDNLNQAVEIIDEMQISFKDYMSLNVSVPRIILTIDVNNINYNIIIDYEDFDLYTFKINIQKDKKYTLLYKENGEQQVLICKFASMQDYTLDFMNKNSTFNPITYFNQLETVININIPNTFPIILSDIINNVIITDKFFNDIIVQDKPMLTIEKLKGRYQINTNSEIIPVEFTSEDIPENIDYLRLVKKYQNYQQHINENSGKLSTFDIKTTLETKFSDSDEQTVNYLSTYFNSENFGISFKHNIHNIWYKLGITPLQIDKNKRPYISGPNNVISIIQTNLFSSFNKIIWFNYLSSDFVETSYLSDIITLPHNYIIGSNNYHNILNGNISLTEHSELFNNIWEAENKPRLNIPLKFNIKTTRNQDVEYALNIGNNETTISDIDKYTIDDNNQMKLNIFKTINTKEIEKMFIYIDSTEHYPFDIGVNGILSVEWIK